MAWGFGDAAEETERDAPGLWGTQAERVKAPVEPMTAAMITAGSQVLGKALSPSGAGPSRADSGGYNIFDNSGFAVSFAGDVGPYSPNARGGDAAASATGGMSSWLIGAAIVGAVIVMVKWAKKH